MARPKFKPTDDHRRLVESMAASRIPPDKIAAVLGIDRTTLRKFFPRELDTSPIKATARVRQTHFEMAISGRCPAATFFWLKTRAGWRERNEPGRGRHGFTELSGVDMAALDKKLMRLLTREPASSLDLIQGQSEAASESPGEGEDEGEGSGFDLGPQRQK